MGAGWGQPRTSPSLKAERAEDLALAVESWLETKTTGAEERIRRALDNYRRLAPRGGW